MVNTDRVVARVGSTFSDVRDVIQVRLDKGEKVELLDAPAERFALVQDRAARRRVSLGVFQVRRSRVARATWRATSAKRPARAIGPTTRSDHRGGVRLTSGGAKDRSRAASRHRARRGPPISPTNGAASASWTVSIWNCRPWSCEEISTWSFGVLDDAGRCPARAGANARSSADEPRSWSTSWPASTTSRSGTTRFAIPKRRPCPVRPEAALAPCRAAVVDPRFDGVGRLSPVISQKAGGPQFALVDASNAVVSFITPAPGVNLRPYVDKYVGVNGQRGYLTDLQRAAHQRAARDAARRPARGSSIRSRSLCRALIFLAARPSALAALLFVAAIAVNLPRPTSSSQAAMLAASTAAAAENFGSPRPLPRAEKLLTSVQPARATAGASREQSRGGPAVTGGIWLRGNYAKAT